MKRFEQSKRLVASGLALTFGTFIMSGVDSNSSAAIKNTRQLESQVGHIKLNRDICTQEQKSQWKSNRLFPVNSAVVSAVLGVSVQSVEAGKFGNASCEPGVMGSIVLAGDLSKVEVRGVSNECLVIGITINHQPNPKTIYKNLLTLCAEPVKQTIITA